MHKLVSEWKALSLEEQGRLYPEITAVFEAAKEARRQSLEAEIRALGFRPGEGRPKAKVKYRSKTDPSKTWSGTGQKAAWLVKEMRDSDLPLDAFLVA